MQKLTVYVTLGHILLFIILCYNVTPPPLDVPRKFAVKTVSLKDDSNIQDVQVATIADVQPTPVPTPKTDQPKKQTAPEKKQTAQEKKQAVPEKKTAKTVTKTPPKKSSSTPSPKKNEALSQAKKALSDLKLTSSSSTVTKNKIGDLNIEGLEGDHYFSDLIAKMQKAMKFPESGEVVVELTLEKNGKVLNMSIKDAKSLSNKMYVEKTLPSIKFPVFEGSLKHEDSHTFIVVLNSVSLD